MRIFSVQYTCFYVSFQICEINGNEYDSLEFRGGSRILCRQGVDPLREPTLYYAKFFEKNLKTGKIWFVNRINSSCAVTQLTHSVRYRKRGDGYATHWSPVPFLASV